MPKPKERGFAELSVGELGSFEVAITEAMVREFAALSGDANPLHLDAAYANTTPFGKCIPHGMIAGALFSRLIGMELPGRSALYVSQTMQFRSPLPFETVVVSGKITQKTESTQMLRIATAVTDVQGRALVTGEALVRVLP